MTYARLYPADALRRFGPDLQYSSLRPTAPVKVQLRSPACGHVLTADCLKSLIATQTQCFSAFASAGLIAAEATQIRGIQVRHRASRQNQFLCHAQGSRYFCCVLSLDIHRSCHTQNLAEHGPDKSLVRQRGRSHSAPNDWPAATGVKLSPTLPAHAMCRVVAAPWECSGWLRSTETTHLPHPLALVKKTRRYNHHDPGKHRSRLLHWLLPETIHSPSPDACDRCG